MLKEQAINYKRARITKSVAAGAILGGILGAVVILFDKTNYLSIPGLGYMLAVGSVDIAITGTVLGMIIGGVAGAIVGSYIPQMRASEHETHNNYEEIQDEDKSSTDISPKLKLREEQLYISKKWIETGKISMHKEVVTEEKNITVPITREILVIEKTAIDSESQDGKDGRIETIRIPICEERIEVIKHPVVLEDVDVYKRQIHGIEHVEETLKKEVAKVEAKGDVKVIDDKT